MMTRDRFRRGATELVVVVAGVLIALSADRWVQALDDRERERTQLEWIAQDLQDDFEMLEGLIERERSRMDGAARLLNAAEDRTYRPSAEVADSLVQSFISSGWGLPPTFTNSTWSEMVAAGDLSLIRDAELRRRLSGYYWYHERIRENEADRESLFRDLERMTNRIRPFVLPEAERTVLAGTLTVEARPGDVDRILEAIRSDDTLRGLVVYSGSAARIRMRNYSEVQDSIAGLIESIRNAS